MGRNKWAASILNSHIKIDGVIDDFCTESHFMGIPVFKMESIPQDSLVVSASMGSAISALKKLQFLGIRAVSYFAFFRYSGLQLEPLPFYSDFKDDFEHNFDSYMRIYNGLKDDKSKKLFEQILNFKITLDLKFLDGVSRNASDQYFEQDVMGQCYKMPFSFVDGGGYTGDTTLQFVDKFQNFKKVYFFEPIPQIMNKAKENLAQFKNIEFFNYGLSDTSEILKFSEDDSSSAISEKGSLSVEVKSLDSVVSDSVDFIKLDIEGAELKAIDGAKNTILKNHPILAICIYHKSSHWYEVPDKILSIRADYDIYLRHYMEGIWETVMYFIPRKNLSTN